jgi:hypothetical protein
MNRLKPWSAAAGLLLAFAVALSAVCRSGKPDVPIDAPPYAPEKYDSFRYYGPNGLYRTWTANQWDGRNTWIFWTGGNQKFIREAAVLADQLPEPISIEFLRLLDSRNRKDRFKLYSLINEPNCEATQDADPDTGLRLDVWKGDPYQDKDGKYAKYSDAQFHGAYPYYPDPKQYPEYGEPTGVVGLRKFRNPKFQWDDAGLKTWRADGMQQYFQRPGSVEPPYLVGFSCAFCHMSFNPLNPPQDPENPRWENLAANIGNQYFREGEMFFAKGRIVFGNRNPGPGYAKDPYDTVGLTANNLLYHYAVTQQPGTSETSRISYDFINNPNTINSIFYLGNRPLFPEQTPDGKTRLVNHVLKDGADSVGIENALVRVWVNIFCEGHYWKDTLFNPATGRRQTPLGLADLRLPVRTDEDIKKEVASHTDLNQKQRDQRSAELLARKKELIDTYGPDVGKDWEEAHRRNPNLLAYLTSYTPYHLADAPGGNQILAKENEQAARGKKVFADHCARCHSNKQPGYTADAQWQREKFFENSVLDPYFRLNNTLSDDVRYSGLEVGTNLARALATNAIDGDVWAELSSKEYKALPPLGKMRFCYTWKNGELTYRNPLQPGEKPGPDDLVIDFTAPGGGRGYYRTPALVSMWATAPYFHNNSLGDYYVKDKDGNQYMFPNDGSALVDQKGRPLTIDTSVEGRLRMFEDGMTKMLWPSMRRHYIKRVASECDIADLQPLVQPLLKGVLTDLLFDYLQSEAARRVDDYLKTANISGAAADVLRKQILDAAQKRINKLRQELSAADLEKVKGQLLILAEGQLLEDLSAVAGPDRAAALKDKLKGLADKLKIEADRLLEYAKAPLHVAKGTPVNLYFNLGSGALPYALKAQILHHDNPRKLAEALLPLSNCPDLVEDEGHTYGEDLADGDKKDLIAFLKTL